jgi:hypothetical protein
MFGVKFSISFATKDLSKKDDVQQKDFLQDLGLLIVKNDLPMQFVENIWMKCLALHLCLWIAMPSRILFSRGVA